MYRVFNFNDDYFESINTEDKAYFLGLLFADGNVYSKTNRVQITLSNKDVYILKEFSERIGYKGKLYLDKVIYSKLILPSKKMCADLTKLGCTPRKSLTLEFPTLVPDHLLHHFIRGCFDGDGHVSFRKNNFNINFTSSKKFIEKFIKLLDSIGVEHTGSKKRYKEHKESACQVYIRAKSAKTFLNYIYRDATIFLKRKKVESDKEKVVKVKGLCSLCLLPQKVKGLCKKHYLKQYHENRKRASDVVF